jgi:ABC-type multidrug transport system ATPase subunit
VEENLLTCADTRRTSKAGYTSGGEQQMIAVGRALMARPKMVLLDEPSMGLAPQIVEEIFQIVKDLNQKEGVSFLIAEQNTTVALRYSDCGYILENGRVVMEGSAQELAASDFRDSNHIAALSPAAGEMPCPAERRNAPPSTSRAFCGPAGRSSPSSSPPTCWSSSTAWPRRWSAAI